MPPLYFATGGGRLVAWRECKGAGKDGKGGRTDGGGKGGRAGKEGKGGRAREEVGEGGTEDEGLGRKWELERQGVETEEIVRGGWDKKE